MKKQALIATGAAILAAAVPLACRLPVTKVFAPTGRIVALNVITAPVGLNLDGVPGPDGFTTKIYATTAENPKAVPIRSGKLEVLMFDGTFFGRTNVPTARQTWSYEAAELKAMEYTASLGTGYEFTLTWGTNHPTQALISIAARYTAENGTVVTSRPSSVNVVNK